MDDTFIYRIVYEVALDYAISSLAMYVGTFFYNKLSY